MNRPILPPALMAALNTAPFDAIIRNYIGSDYDLGSGNGLTGEAIWYYVTILNIDTVPSVILPLLAVMFGVDGIKGFNYCIDEAAQRACIKNAMLKHRRHATPWSLKTALEDAGFTNIILNEHLPVLYWDGSINFDGTHVSFSNFWADFTLSMDPPLNWDGDIDALMLLINYWKRACTRCISVTINSLVIFSFGIGDEQLIWDGTFDFDGSELSTG